MQTFTAKHYLELEPGSLDNNKGDIDRINTALRVAVNARGKPGDLAESSVQNIHWPLGLIETGSEILRSAHGRITVTVFSENSAGADGSSQSYRVAITEPGDTTESHYGVAVDLGTTMVAAELVDMKSGETLASAGLPNGQIIYGEDLLTRLHYASQGGLEKLNSALIDTVNGLIDELCNAARIKTRMISALSAAGNTSMTHLFLGLSPSALRQAPFVPTINHIPILTAKDIGINITSYAPVYCFPSVGSYLGGDLVAGAIASGITNNDNMSLLLDIGTNGEMILGNKDWLIAGAGAAGPALEGGVAECAGRAEPGAIDNITIDPETYDPLFHVIGDAPAKNLCGSGLVDTIAQLFKTGLLDSTGRFSLEIKTGRWIKVNGRNAYLIQDAAEPGDKAKKLPVIYITDKDIESFIRTKAAMTAALTVLLDSVGLQLDDISHIYTAGSFGLHVSVESAAAIGLYPRLPAERFTLLGNGSLRGAREALLNSGRITKAEKIADKITYLELSVHPSFMSIFRSAKYF
jgi:uncharacterized 2Fe-2S/4Fe-4S cluster protein (DUF4445 family)